MGKIRENIDERLRLWIAAQRLFFVATAPAGREGHINCSPKGADSFRIIDENTAAYLDFTGSGAETIAHLRENGRIVVMFCAFEGPPQIARLHGRGEVVLPGEKTFEELKGLFPDKRGVRSIIRVHVRRVSTSCGFSVPLYDFKEDRRVLDEWVERKSDAEIIDYQRKNNAVSIDGIPALKLED